MPGAFRRVGVAFILVAVARIVPDAPVNRGIGFAGTEPPAMALRKGWTSQGLLLGGEDFQVIGQLDYLGKRLRAAVGVAILGRLIQPNHEVPFPFVRAGHGARIGRERERMR